MLLTDFMENWKCATSFEYFFNENNSFLNNSLKLMRDFLPLFKFIEFPASHKIKSLSTSLKALKLVEGVPYKIYVISGKMERAIFKTRN